MYTTVYQYTTLYQYSTAHYVHYSISVHYTVSVQYSTLCTLQYISTLRCISTVHYSTVHCVCYSTVYQYTTLYQYSTAHYVHYSTVYYSTVHNSTSVQYTAVQYNKLSNQEVPCGVSTIALDLVHVSPVVSLIFFIAKQTKTIKLAWVERCVQLLTSLPSAVLDWGCLYFALWCWRLFCRGPFVWVHAVFPHSQIQGLYFSQEDTEGTLFLWVPRCPQRRHVLVTQSRLLHHGVTTPLRSKRVSCGETPEMLSVSSALDLTPDLSIHLMVLAWVGCCLDGRQKVLLHPPSLRSLLSFWVRRSCPCSPVHVCCAFSRCGTWLLLYSGHSPSCPRVSWRSHCPGSSFKLTPVWLFLSV